MKEIELIDIFCEYLDDQNIEYKRELRKGIYHNEGYIDVVIKIDDIYHAIEAKITAYESVIRQASANKVLCHYSWILTDKKPSGYHIILCERGNIGIISLIDGKIVFIKKPNKHISSFFSYYRFEIIERNWRMGRYGRRFHEREIPDGYDKEKLKKLQKKNKGMSRKEYYEMRRKYNRERRKEWYKKQKEYRKKIMENREDEDKK